MSLLVFKNHPYENEKKKPKRQKTVNDPEAAVINYEEVMKITGFKRDGVAFLVKKGVLVPLGNPGVTTPKTFPRLFIEELAKNNAWLNQATLAIAEERAAKRAKAAERKAAREALKREVALKKAS